MTDKPSPPSATKYRIAHPVVSVTLTAELKEALDCVKGSLSYAQYLKQLIESSNEVMEALYDEAYEVGYTDAKAEYRVTFPCTTCGKPISIRVGSDCHQDIIAYLKSKGWSHVDCHRRST